MNPVFASWRASSAAASVPRARVLSLRVAVSSQASFRRLYSSSQPSHETPPASPSKTLAQILFDSIKASGPLSVSTFMRTCLLDPAQGYYASANSKSDEASSSRHVLGARGDFITSPEISQVFGELMAIFFVARWQATEMSPKTRLVELGPGKGTLMADMIRTFSRFGTFFSTLKEIHLVETSPGLMEMQFEAISEAMSRAGKKLVAADKQDITEDEVRIEWFPLIDSVPIQADTWSMVIAHEFFDALPTHIFEKSGDGFREVLIDIERTDKRRGGITVLKPSDISRSSFSQKQESKDEKPPKFRYVLSPTSTPWSMVLAARNPRFRVLQPGQRVEVSPESWAAARRVGELVAGRAAKGVPDQNQDGREQVAKIEAERVKGKSVGGAGLIIDYGDDKAFGGSFRVSADRTSQVLDAYPSIPLSLEFRCQAFKSHQIVDPLLEPGTADLTANVDFLHLKSAVATTDARYLGPMFQAHFLKALGLEQRVEALKKNAATEERKKEIESAARRLVDATGMGAQYKVLGISAEQTEGEASAEGNRCYPFEM